MPRYFIGTTIDYSDGFLQLYCGNSISDEKTYMVYSNGLKADEVPEPMHDAKTTAQLMAGLLNAYFSKVDVSGWPPEKVMKCGQPDEECEVPSPANPELPF